MNGDVAVTGGRTTSVPVISKLPFEDAFLADLALDFFFLIGVLLGTAALPALEGGRLERGEGGLGLPSRPGEGAVRTRIGLTITDWDLPLMIDDALEDDGLLKEKEKKILDFSPIWGVSSRLRGQEGPSPLFGPDIGKDYVWLPKSFI